MNVQERVKWNRLRTSLSLSELAEYFSRSIYSDEKGYGYSAIDIDGTGIGATYTEKNIIENVTVDPLGNEFNQVMTEYISIRFSLILLTNKLYLFCVYNPPKSIKNFIDKLSSDLSYKIGLSSIDIDLNKLHQTMRDEQSISLMKLCKIKISSLVVNENSKASIEVSSRKNAIDDLHELTKERKFKIDKMKINCLLDGKNSEFEISKAGSLVGRTDQIPFYTGLVINQLLENEG